MNWLLALGAGLIVGACVTAALLVKAIDDYDDGLWHE